MQTVQWCICQITGTNKLEIMLVWGGYWCSSMEILREAVSSSSSCVLQFNERYSYVIAFLSQNSEYSYLAKRSQIIITRQLIMFWMEGEIQSKTTLLSTIYIFQITVCPDVLFIVYIEFSPWCKPLLDLQDIGVQWKIWLKKIAFSVLL